MNLRKRLVITFITLLSLPILFLLSSLTLVFVVRDPMLSRHFVIQSIWIMTAIMILYALIVTTWVNRGVFKHIREMNEAMDHIAKGDFDYSLDASRVDGEFRSLFKAYEDMRLKLKESTEERVRDEAQNRELISNITHDLKTPITSIKGYAEGIIDGVADTDEKKERYIRTIYDKTKDLDRLLNELTFYSSIDNNKIPYNFKKLDVVDFFNDCVDEVGMDLENRNIYLSYENLLDRGTLIIADPVQLRKVINNIIGNSVKYMDKEEKAISIRLLDSVDSVRVEIDDNGKGIASNDLANIFERFFRTDDSSNSSQGGSGIGLSIVKKIIEDHGGYIWATSKEGEGTCMHFVIRKYIENKKVEEESVLIIEDELAIAELEKDYLELSDFEVDIESTGDGGLERALANDYDIIILDLMLPGIDGFDVCKKIREEKQIPILMVSAKKDDIDKIRGLGLGADDYMTKPFSPSELVARVKAHLSRYERLMATNQKVNDVIEIRGIRIDKTARRVYINGEEKQFTTKEFDLLTFLAENPNHVFSKEELFREIWDMDSIGDIATVTVHIKKIREKIEIDTSNPQYIETIWGVGYRFKV